MAIAPSTAPPRRPGVALHPHQPCPTAGVLRPVTYFNLAGVRYRRNRLRALIHQYEIYRANALDRARAHTLKIRTYKAELERMRAKLDEYYRANGYPQGHKKYRPKGPKDGDKP